MDSFSTVATKSYYDSFYDAARDGTFISLREQQRSIGLGDRQYLLPWGESDQATPFNGIKKKDGNLSVRHLSAAETEALYQQNLQLSERLEQVMQGSAGQQDWYRDPQQRVQFETQLTQLLEINHLTPGQLLEDSDIPAREPQRDGAGNARLKARWEHDFARSYLTDTTAQQATDRLMTKLADRLIGVDRDEQTSMTTELDEWKKKKKIPKSKADWEKTKESKKKALMTGKERLGEEAATARAEEEVNRLRLLEQQSIQTQKTQLEKKTLNYKILNNDYVRSDFARLRQRLPKNYERISDRDLLLQLLRNELHVDITFSERQALRQQLFFHALRPAAQHYTVSKSLQEKIARMEKPLTVNNRKLVPDPWRILNPGEKTSEMRIVDDKLQSSNRFRPDDSEMSRYMATLDAPFTGGVSGSTRDITLRHSQLLGSLTAREYWDFQLFNAAQMIENGYHSFFEALYVAAYCEPLFFEGEGGQLRAKFDALHQRATQETSSRVSYIVRRWP